jgi:hypothetical protein
LFIDDYNALPIKMKEYFIENDIEVIVTQEDYKSHKKYLFSMQKYKDIPVITVDDDAVYTNDMVDALYSDYLKTPRTVIGRRIRRMVFDENGKTRPYSEWQFVEGEGPDLDLFATTGGGTLFPPEYCRLINSMTINEVKRTKTELCDDFFMHYVAQENNIPTKCVDYRNGKVKYFRGFMQEYLDISKNEQALWNVNQT